MPSEIEATFPWIIYTELQDRERKYEDLDRLPVLEWKLTFTGPNGYMKTQRSEVICTKLSDGIPTRSWSWLILDLESFTLKDAASR